MRDLNHAHLGSGINVYDRNVEEHGDYKKIAHIDADRNVTWYIDQIDSSTDFYVYNLTLFPNKNVSATQVDQVFNKTKSLVLYAINCRSVKIAREIEPAFRATVTEGVPALYTFKALPAYRAPEALALRKRVADVLRAQRASK